MFNWSVSRFTACGQCKSWKFYLQLVCGKFHFLRYYWTDIWRIQIVRFQNLDWYLENTNCNQVFPSTGWWRFYKIIFDWWEYHHHHVFNWLKLAGENIMCSTGPMRKKIRCSTGWWRLSGPPLLWPAWAVFIKIQTWYFSLDFISITTNINLANIHIIFKSHIWQIVNTNLHFIAGSSASCE